MHSDGETGRASSTAEHELGGGSDEDDEESEDYFFKHGNLESFLKSERGSSVKAAAPNNKNRVGKVLMVT
jgi:hypothetical protein